MNDSNLQVLDLYNIESEYAVLGALMQFPKAYDDVVDLILPEHFFIDKHQKIAKIIFGLAERGKSFDVISVMDKAGSRIDELGGMPYLNSVITSVSGYALTKNHAQIVKDKFIKRSLRIAVDECNVNLADGSAQDVADALIDAVERIIAVRKTSEPLTARECVHRLVSDIENKKFGDNQNLVPTGLPSVDAFFNGGFERGNVVIVAGRPSMGKTALATSLALPMAENYNVLMFSMEMSEREITRRCCAAVGAVPSTWLTGSSDANNDQYWESFSDFSEAHANKKFWVDDRGLLSVAQIRQTCKRHKRKHGLDVVVIDYLGLMNIKTDKGGTRAQAIGEVTAQLKAMAKDLGVVLILLHQLNRGNTERNDKRPNMSDLRDSGAIEQDADIIMLIHREEYYDSENTNAEGHAEIIVDKYRAGQRGILNMTFEAQYCRFVTWDGQRHSKKDAQKQSSKGFGGKESYKDRAQGGY